MMCRQGFCTFVFPLTFRKPLLTFYGACCTIGSTNTVSASFRGASVNLVHGG